jgi:hypothetical protein
MRLQSLNHLIEVVRAVARSQRVLILDSASLLPSHPELGDPGKPLELTNDADLLVEPVNEGIAESLQLAAGLDSAFMARFGYCADILRPAMRESLPAGWETRLRPVTGFDHVFALDPYDVALVKLIVGRPKDLELLRALLKLAIIEPARLRRHYHATPLGEHEASIAGRNLGVLLEASGGG